MTKKELYDALKLDGAKLKAVNFYSPEQLEKLYAERFGDDEFYDEPNTEKIAEPDDISESVPEIHTLVFDHSGWCDELNRSYFQGVSRPATVKEYLTLRKFACKEI